MPDGPLLTVAEVAAHLNVSQWLVREVIASRDLPSVRVGRTIRVRPESLRSWEAAQERGES